MADDTTTSPDPSPTELSPAEPELEAGQELDVQASSTPAPEPAAPPEPSVAATFTAEPLEPASAPLVAPSSSGADEGEGGEWELLLQKLGQWLNQNELQTLWSQASKPVTALAALVGLLLVLRIYSALLGALDSLPLVPGLLELAGVVWVVRYGVPKLLRSSERERLLGGLSQRWKAFRGKS